MAAELAQRFQVYHAQQDTTKRFGQPDVAARYNATCGPPISSTEHSKDNMKAKFSPTFTIYKIRRLITLPDNSLLRCFAFWKSSDISALSLFSFGIKNRIAEIDYAPYNARWRTLGTILNGSRQYRASRPSSWSPSAARPLSPLVSGCR
jgi:hypothetical protein